MLRSWGIESEAAGRSGRALKPPAWHHGAAVVIALALVSALIIPLYGTLWRRYFYRLSEPLPAASLDALGRRPGWEIDRFAVTPGVELVGLVRRPLAGGGPWLLFFHGNGGPGLPSAQDALEKLGQEPAWGLCAFSYRGFGASGGTPSETAFYADALAIVERMRQRFGVEPAQLRLVGNSLGATVAVHLGARLTAEGRAPAGLVLLAAVSSGLRLYSEHRPWVPWRVLMLDQYRTVQYAPALRSPVLIVHGAADTVVPAHHARELAALLGDRAELLVRDGLGHSDLLADHDVLVRIRRFVAEVGGRGEPQ